MTGSSDTTGLISNVIRRTLNIECAVLMGANIAPEVSIECFCEATVGQSFSVCVYVSSIINVSASIVSLLTSLLVCLSVCLCVSVCTAMSVCLCVLLCMPLSGGWAGHPG